MDHEVWIVNKLDSSRKKLFTGSELECALYAESLPESKNHFYDITAEFGVRTFRGHMNEEVSWELQ